MKSSAKHRKLTGTAATCGERSLVAQNRVVPGFLENAFVDDNDHFQVTTKTKASAPENRRVETAMATNVPAKLSAAQIGAIHDPLSPPPSRPVPGPWATHRAKPPPIILLPLCFLPCSLGPKARSAQRKQPRHCARPHGRMAAGGLPKSCGPRGAGWRSELDRLDGHLPVRARVAPTTPRQKTVKTPLNYAYACSGAWRVAART